MGSGKSSERPSRQTDNRNERKKTGRIKVIVVDDHPAIREALIHTISTKIDLELCGQAGSAEEAFDLAKSADVDVAVIDISLQDAYGLDLVDSLRTQYPDLQVVVFSMYDESVYAERALRAGALGYVMKSEPTQAVIDAVRTVSDGEVYLSGRMASRILSKMTSSPSSGPAFAVDELTDREMAVFQMLGNRQRADLVQFHCGIARQSFMLGRHLPGAVLKPPRRVCHDASKPVFAQKVA